MGKHSNNCRVVIRKTNHKISTNSLKYSQANLDSEMLEALSAANLTEMQLMLHNIFMCKLLAN